jgi:hypothetical protein
VNVKFGPPFSAMNSFPSSLNTAVITEPFGPGPVSPYRVTVTMLEFGKIDV